MNSNRNVLGKSESVTAPNQNQLQQSGGAIFLNSCTVGRGCWARFDPQRIFPPDKAKVKQRYCQYAGSA
jgi:hypothetical protein